MSFQPSTFIRTARHLSAIPKSDAHANAHYRTAAGRCYYAVYGYLSERLCTGKGTTRKALFGTSGRHSDLSAALARAPAGIKRASPGFTALLFARVRSDYDYTASGDIGLAEIGSLIKTAEDVLVKLGAVQDKDFGSLLF